jgi:hypothetical protein
VDSTQIGAYAPFRNVAAHRYFAASRFGQDAGRS